MICYVCATRDTREEAVALCKHCNAGLCLDHLRETAAGPHAGGVSLGCGHGTWSARQG